MGESVGGKKRLLMRFQDGFEKEMSMNQLTIVTVERRPITKEYEVPEIYAMPEEEVDLEK